MEKDVVRFIFSFVIKNDCVDGSCVRDVAGVA